MGRHQTIKDWNAWPRNYPRVQIAPRIPLSLLGAHRRRSSARTRQEGVARRTWRVPRRGPKRSRPPRTGIDVAHGELFLAHPETYGESSPTSSSSTRAPSMTGTAGRGATSAGRSRRLPRRPSLARLLRVGAPTTGRSRSRRSAQPRRAHASCPRNAGVCGHRPAARSLRPGDAPGPV